MKDITLKITFREEKEIDVEQFKIDLESDLANAGYFDITIEEEQK